MTTSKTERRKQLETRLAELLTRLDHIEHDLDEPLPKDSEDAAIELEDDETLEALGEAGEAEVAKIRAALKRMDDGTYGVCVRCGETISEARLDVLPFTPLCKDCAAEA